MVQAVVALGSNLGDRAARLQEALDSLKGQVRVAQASRVYDTAPMYVVDQPPYLNAAVMVETDRPPLAMLRLLKCIEREVGRLKRERFGPREIDLDLIAYGALEYRYREDGRTVLQLPHPRVAERRFVLQPLFDLDPMLVLPGLDSVAELLAATRDQADSVQVCEDAVLSL